MYHPPHHPQGAEAAGYGIQHPNNQCEAYSQHWYIHQCCFCVDCILQISFSSYQISLSFNQSFVTKIRYYFLMIGTGDPVLSVVQYIRYQGTWSWIMEAQSMEPMYLSIQPEKTGERIRKLLLEQGYTIREIQGAFGFENPQAIYKWLSGKSLPSIDNFIILSRLLHTTIEDILVIDGDIPRLWGILNRWLNDSHCRVCYNRIRSKWRKMKIERTKLFTRYFWNL